MDIIGDILMLRDINELREDLDRLRRQGEAGGFGPHQVRQLAEENLELKLRLSLLVCLLIAKGVFSAEEFAGLLAGARGTR
jgi:hypothetical protein